MALFYIVPPRKVSGSTEGTAFVGSLNNLRGDITLDATDGLQLTGTGNTLTITPVDGHFVLKGGDTFLGNLDFLPASGGYGLRVLTAAADPAQNATGALYFNTADGVLKVYNGATWASVAQGGSLSQADADARYLKLDASNSPLTGELLLGSASLRLGALSADPVGGTQGDLYFNATSQSARLYTSAGWQNIAGGISSVTAGTGLTGGHITSSGTIALDLTYSPVWTGTHTFNQQITFSSSQLFAVGKLATSGQTKGDLIAFDGTSWGRLPVGSAGQLLAVGGSGMPVWQTNTDMAIGTPTPPAAYSAGYFDTWTSTTLVADAFEQVSVLLTEVAPAKADLFTGLDLVPTSLPTTYSARISAGNTAAWYPSGYSAGSLISNRYFLSGRLSFASPNTSTCFRCGKANRSDTWGTITHLVTAADGSTTAQEVYDMTGGPGWQWELTVTTISTYNNVWAKANATVSYDQSTDGYLGQSLSHTEAGATNVSGFWMDTWTNANQNPSFSAPPTVSLTTHNQKWQSGVLYIGLNSVFSVSFGAATGIFRYCYHPTHVAQITYAGLATVDVNPGTTPNWGDVFDCTGSNARSVTLSTSNQASLDTTVTVTLYKAGPGTAVQTTNLPYRICTYGTLSTTTSESFQDEAQRLLNDSTTAFDSTVTPVASGYLQVRQGALVYPVSADYAGSPSLIGEREWQRYFYKTSASTGTLTFGTLTYDQIDPYGTGQVNILLKLEGDGLYYDLGRRVGDNNGSGSGTTRADSLGCRVSGVGGAVTWSVGLQTTGASGAGNNGRFRLIVIYTSNTTTRQITSIVSS